MLTSPTRLCRKPNVILLMSLRILVGEPSDFWSSLAQISYSHWIVAHCPASSHFLYILSLVLLHHTLENLFQAQSFTFSKVPSDKKQF